MSLSGAFYRTLTTILEPAVGLGLRFGARGEGAEDHAQRRGATARRPVDQWWHAASLGEVAALEPVIAAARERGLLGTFCVTTATVAGRDAARQISADSTLAPLDFPRLVSRVLSARDPGALILVETELWPNLLGAAQRRKVPIAIVNGRVSDKHWPRYRRFRGLFGSVLKHVRAVAARTEIDATRYRELGVPEDAVTVTGNTKHDRLSTNVTPASLPWGDDPVWTAGSVHLNEAEIVLDAYERLRRRYARLRLVLAPRHADVVRGVTNLLEGRDLQWSKWSRREKRVGKDVVLLDTRGELMSFYAASRVAFVGGTLVPVGGHNPVEPALLGVPVILGPHVGNVAEDDAALREGGGARRVAGVGEIAGALTVWLEDPASLREMGEKARETARSLQGGSARTVSWLVDRGVLKEDD